MTLKRAFKLGKLHERLVNRERSFANAVDFYRAQAVDTPDGRHFRETCLAPAVARWEKCKVAVTRVENRMLPWI